MGGPAVPYGERVHVTISRKGAIFLNQKAHKMMGSPHAVYLYFNRPKDMIVIEPTSALTASNAFLTKESAGFPGRRIYANPFCKNFRIRIEAAQKFLNPETDAAGRMYLKLSETITVATGPRKKSQRRLR